METPGNTSIFEKGSLLGDRYRLDQLLAGGGMAEVWRAHDTILDRAVAVKLLHPHLAGDATVAERFRREAISAARLSHPHIVPTFDTGVDGDTAFIVMGLVHGTTLRELLSDGPIELRFAIAIARQVADALAYSHSKDLIHRDMKPSNVLVVEGTNRVMVADFGIAKAVEHSNDPSLTMPGFVVGTFEYAAPEQLKGESLDGRTDVFALGILLHEMVCGHTSAEDLPTRVGNVDERSTAKPQCDQIPEVLKPIIEKATSDNPDDRFQTALKMREELAVVERQLFEFQTPQRSSYQTHTSQTEAITGDRTSASVPAIDQPKKRSKMHGSKQSRIALIVMIILVIVAASVGKLFGSMGTDNQTQTPSQTSPVSSIKTSSFDPQGDGEEHESTAALAVDGNNSTSWTTETYNQRTFGTKSGVGLRLILPNTTPLRSMSVNSGSQGWAAQIYVANNSPNTLEGWGSPVDTQSGLESQATFDLHGVSGNSVLLWITDVGADRRFTANEITIQPQS